MYFNGRTGFEMQNYGSPLPKESKLMEIFWYIDQLHAWFLPHFNLG